MIPNSLFSIEGLHFDCRHHNSSVQMGVTMFLICTLLVTFVTGITCQFYMSSKVCTLPDDELIALLNAGNVAAFQEIYNRYNEVLFKHIFHKTGDREETRDIIHDVFESLWRNRESLVIDRTLLGYLYTCARNIFLNQVARKERYKKYQHSIAAFALTGEVLTDHQARERQLQNLIEQEIASLPAKMGQVFKMSRRENLTHEQIAQQLHISEQTVSKQISNALKLLRIKLEAVLLLLTILHFF